MARDLLGETGVDLGLRRLGEELTLGFIRRLCRVPGDTVRMSCFASVGVTTSNASNDDIDPMDACDEADEDEAVVVEEVVEAVEEEAEEEVVVEEDEEEEEYEGEEGEAMGGKAMPIRERERRETVLVKSLLPIQTRMKRSQATRMIRMTKETS